MAEVNIEERFARFEAEAPGTFRPAPLVDVAARARRRRRFRRTLLAGLVAALVVTPAGALAVAGRDDSRPSPLPPPGPTGSATPGPAVFRPIERRVVLPGVDLPLLMVRFVQDARHAWALQGSCPGENEKGACRYALGSTSDGGVTWRTANLPDLGTSNQPLDLEVLALDARTLTIHVVGKRFWLTTDGGLTFASYPVSAPPAQALLGLSWPHAGNRFNLLCPGTTGFADGMGAGCDRPELVRVGVGPVPTQPTIPGPLREVLGAKDGRLWALSADGDTTRVAVSTDEAVTWKEVGSVPGQAELTVSPDGADVWLAATSTSPRRLWRLAGDVFVAQTGVPDGIDLFTVKAAGGGVLAMVTGQPGRGGNTGFWHDGTFSVVKDLDAGWDVDVLPDGSLVLTLTGGGWAVGTGTGLDRAWVSLR